MDSMDRLDRSASSKRSSVTSSWAMAGTMNAMLGRLASTSAIQVAASKRGRNRARMPIFMGL